MTTQPNAAVAAAASSPNIQSSPNLTKFDPKLVAPSQPIYFQRNDFFEFVFFTNTAGLTARVNYRWLTPDGEIKEGQFNTAPFLGFTFGQAELFEGWLLSLAASITSAPVAGQLCYLQVLLARGFTTISPLNAQEEVWSGYIYSNSWRGFPGSPSKEITDGPGVLRFITGTTPGAGGDIAETVPANRRWTLVAFFTQLTTSAIVANRFPRARFDNGASSFFFIGPSVAQTAGTTVNYTFTPGSQFFNDTNGSIVLPLPDVSQLKSTWRILTSTLNIQAGDQWISPLYVVQEWGMWDP